MVRLGFFLAPMMRCNQRFEPTSLELRDLSEALRTATAPQQFQDNLALASVCLCLGGLPFKRSSDTLRRGCLELKLLPLIRDQGLRLRLRQGLRLRLLVLVVQLGRLADPRMPERVDPL